MKIRIFVAVKIASSALGELLKIRDEVSFGQNLKWEGKEKLHLTLKFIGDFEESNIPALVDELKQISNKFENFELGFSHFGIFKRNGLPLILYAGFERSKELVNLHKEIDEMLVLFGVEKEKRKFKPHLTLLRIKNRKIQNINKFLEREISQIKFKVDEFYLIKSELKPTGSVYNEIENFKLK